MKKHYHFIGIGGVGMSALSRILLKQGHTVSGSDKSQSATLDALKGEGATVFVGHKKGQLKNPDFVIYSTASEANNEEYKHAKKQKYTLWHRSELLAQLLAGNAPLLVAGTHGKTTTSSLLAHVLLEAGLDPSFAIGGTLQNTGTNGHYGRGLHFIAEADESDGSFLKYPSFGAIITNCEKDHMEYWKTEKNLKEAFAQFALNVGSKEHLFWGYDDPILRALKLPGTSFGFDRKADLVIDNFVQTKWTLQFDVTFEGKHHKGIEVPLIGAHNVLNAAVCFGMGLKLDIKKKALLAALKTFKGIGRRIEKKGEVGGIEIYDDYAHHPTEIFATLRALKNIYRKRRLVVAFQPHRYSRTKCCMDDFAEAFEHADKLILTDIYAGGEKPLEGVCSSHLLDLIHASGNETACLVEKSKLPTFLTQTLKSGDVLITMGAGDITTLGPKVLDLLGTKGK